jgi:hypothetical protein
MKTGDVVNQFFIFKFLALLTHMTEFLIESFRWRNLCNLPFWIFAPRRYVSLAGRKVLRKYIFYIHKGRISFDDGIQFFSPDVLYCIMNMILTNRKVWTLWLFMYKL